MSPRAVSTASGNSACQPWDIAAGILLVREAGGYVTDINGGNDMMKSGNVLAANDHLHAQLAKLLRELLPSPALT